MASDHHRHHSTTAFDLAYYTKSALAGGICCSVTHAAMCPLDVAKTRIQLSSGGDKGQSLTKAIRTIVAQEGVSALATGLGPTAVGYFVQGWFKFGGVEFFKINFAQSLGDETSWRYRASIYLVSSACAEFIADIFLCPLEATRIRLVANPTYATGLLTAVPKILREDGVVRGFYSGFGPILLKQVPYTMAKFAVQGMTAEKIYLWSRVDANSCSEATKTTISLTSGLVAGVTAAVVSHPADTLLSMINRSPTAGGTGGIASRLVNLAKATGFKKLCVTGLGARCVMIGALTAGQFAIFDNVMAATGAQKFHFHPPPKSLEGVTK